MAHMFVKGTYLDRAHGMVGRTFEGFPRISRSLFGGPYNKDRSIMGSRLGSPDVGKLSLK